MLTFMTPLMLAGGLLIAIPIVLHLVMREKPKHLVFPALRFVRQRREANRRRLRLRHLALLLLRCAVILLFALALAKPIFESAGLLIGGQAPVAAALVFDTRPQMQYLHRNETRLEAAKQLGLEVLGQLPRESELVVLDSDSARTRFDVDRGAATQRVEHLVPTYRSRDLIEVVDGALSILRRSDKQRKEIFLFTDLSAADWQSETALAKWQQRFAENPGVLLYVLDVGVRAHRNFSLGDLDLSREILAESAMLAITTDVESQGAAGRRTVQLEFSDGEGATEKKGEETVECADGETVQIDFRSIVGQTGWRQGEVRLAGSDNLAVDDVRYLTIGIQPPWQVLLVAGAPAERNARMLAGALAPPTLKRRGDARYELEVVAFDQLDEQPLEAFDAVWLLDPPPLKPAVWNRLSGYVNEGGGLAVALGGQAGLTGAKFNASASFDLLPAELKRQWKRDDLYFAPDRLEHPVLQKFKGREGSIPWQLNPIFKIWELEPPVEGVQVLLSYNDRRPALLSRNVGRGRVLTLTTSLVPSSRSPWSELLAPREEAWPGFVLVNSMTEYLVGSVGQRLNYRVGDVVEIQLEPGKREYSSYLLTTPDDTRRVKANVGDDTVLVTGTAGPGHYRLEAGGRQGVRYGFSLNLPAAATRSGRADEKELKEKLGDAAFPIVRTAEQLRQSRKVAAARSRWEAYPWLVVLVVLVAIGENLLSTLFYQKAREKD